MNYRFFIARRYLASRHHASLISIITGISVAGVALGVAALIVVLSVMNGFYDFVQDLLVSLDPHVRVVSAEGRQGLSNADSLRRVVLRTEHVEEAAPYVQGKALLVPEEGSQVNKVVIVRGADSSALRGVSQVVEQTGFGRFSLRRENGRPGLVMGMSLGRRFGLLPAGGTAEASTVGLLSAPALEQMLTQVFGPPPIYRFEVRGLYEMQAVYDESHVFVDLEEAQRLFNMKNRVTGIDLRLDDLHQADAVKRALQRQLSPEYRIETWYDLQKSLYDVMRLEKWGAWAILLLIIVVAVFNIVGSLTMVVIEKRRDVGVLQAMGVSPKNIRRIFLTEGFLIGGVGTGVGFALGLGLSLLQKHFELVPMAGAESFLLDAYPVAIRGADLAIVGGVALTLCMVAAVYPAFRAAAIAPARAVQME